MRNHARLWLILVLILTTPFATSLFQPADEGGKEQESVFPELSGPYLGQEPPGMKPVLFAPGIVSTGSREWSSSFTPDGKFYCFGLSGPPKNAILFMKEKDGLWTEPTAAPFSGTYSEYDFNLTPDGSKLLYTSHRPPSGIGAEKSDSDIWMVERTASGWGEPRPLGSPINTDNRELYPSMTHDGTLYFFSNRPGGRGGSDVYRARFVDGKFTEPENLGDGINTEENESDPFVAADESFIIVTSSRPGGFGRGDLYVSFRGEDGSWGTLINLGETINTADTEFCPSITPDGKYIFFTSTRAPGIDYPPIKLGYKEKLGVAAGVSDRNIDIYWVDARIIEQFRQ